MTNGRLTDKKQMLLARKDGIMNKTLTGLSLSAFLTAAGALYAAGPATAPATPDPRLPEAVQHNDLSAVKSPAATSCAGR